MYARQRLYNFKMTLQKEILEVKKKLRLQRKLTKEYATLVSKIHFKKNHEEDIVQIMRAIYKDVFNEKAHF